MMIRTRLSQTPGGGVTPSAAPPPGLSGRMGKHAARQAHGLARPLGPRHRCRTDALRAHHLNGHHGPRRRTPRHPHVSHGRVGPRLRATLRPRVASHRERTTGHMRAREGGSVGSVLRADPCLHVGRTGHDSDPQHHGRHHDGERQDATRTRIGPSHEVTNAVERARGAGSHGTDSRLTTTVTAAPSAACAT